MAALKVIVVAARVETLTEYTVDVDPGALTTKFPELSKSPPVMVAIKVSVMPAPVIEPRSLNIPVFEIFTKCPAINATPLLVIVLFAIPYKNPSTELYPIASTEPGVYAGPIA